MKCEPTKNSTKRKKILPFATVVILGSAAVTLAHATTSPGRPARHPVETPIIHIWVNGHAIPASAQSRVIHFPGGVMHIQTVTWGSGMQPGRVRITDNSLSTVRARAMVESDLQQMRSMQVSMDREVAQMQRMMQQMAFSPLTMPQLGLPMQVLIPAAPPAGVQRTVSPTLPAIGPHEAPPLPITEMPGHQVLSVRWNHKAPTQQAAPKVPV